MTGPEGFSNWVLALLPHLFLYPGGLWLLVALLGLRLVSGGPATIKPRVLASDLLQASLSALALAWVAVSVTPLPGASPLAAPVDSLILVALLLVSHALDTDRIETYSTRDRSVSLPMALGILGADAHGHLHSGYMPDWSLSSAFAMLCVAAGLVASVSAIGRDLASEVRWLAWLGLGFLPVLKGWTEMPVTGVYWSSLVYAVTIAIFAFTKRGLPGYKYSRNAKVSILVWGLALFALLAGVLGY